MKNAWGSFRNIFGIPFEKPLTMRPLDGRQTQFGVVFIQYGRCKQMILYRRLDRKICWTARNARNACLTDAEDTPIFKRDRCVWKIFITFQTVVINISYECFVWNNNTPGNAPIRTYGFGFLSYTIWTLYTYKYKIKSCYLNFIINCHVANAGNLV